jgi:hypothetical protein
VANVARLWNPRSSHRLRRYWISFEEQIVIGGESPEQTGVLSVRPACQGELRARLRVMGRKFEEPVWINGLKLFVCVKAVEDARMLVAFGIPSGSTVNVTLEPGAGAEDDAKTAPSGYRRIYENGAGSPIGLCQTQP